jgi:hypothetical protein
MIDFAMMDFANKLAFRLASSSKQTASALRCQIPWLIRGVPI